MSPSLLDVGNPCFVQESKDSTAQGEKAPEKKGDDLIDVEDSDDYLFYLEDILKTIHKVNTWSSCRVGHGFESLKMIPTAAMSDARH